MTVHLFSNDQPHLCVCLGADLKRIPHACRERNPHVEEKTNCATQHGLYFINFNETGKNYWRYQTWPPLSSRVLLNTTFKLVMLSYMCSYSCPVGGRLTDFNWTPLLTTTEHPDTCILGNMTQVVGMGIANPPFYWTTRSTIWSTDASQRWGNPYWGKIFLVPKLLVLDPVF